MVSDNVLEIFFILFCEQKVRLEVSQQIVWRSEVYLNLRSESQSEVRLIE